MAVVVKNSYEQLFAYLFVFILFYFFLAKLISIALKNIKKPHALPKLDQFIKDYGYSYDYVFVCQVYDETDSNFNASQMELTMGNIIERLLNAGLEAKFFYSCQRDEVYIKIRAELKRLTSEAGRISYRLQLDPDRLRSKALLGKKRLGEVVWKPIVIVDEFRQSKLKPFDFIFAPYNDVAEADGLYKVYPALNNHKHIFRPVDRINLIVSIIEGNINSQPPGAGQLIKVFNPNRTSTLSDLHLFKLNIEKLMNDRVIKGAFPLHDYDQLKSLQIRWLNMLSAPWEQPIEVIKDYFGDRIGFYFHYLAHYVEQLMIPAVLGWVVFIVRTVYGKPENFLMPWFAGYMLVWSTMYIEIWKRKQVTAAMQWGTVGFQQDEQDRPLFDGIQIQSPVNGKPMTHFPELAKFTRTKLTLTAIFVMLDGVIAIVASIFYFEVVLAEPQNRSYFLFYGFDLSKVMSSLLQSASIVALNLAYVRIATRLNNYENHRTDTEYEDFLISKIFMFQMVNSYASLTYLAFVKSFLNFTCPMDNCSSDVADNLGTIFLSSLLSRAMLQVFVRKFRQELREQRIHADLPSDSSGPSPIEEQFVLDEYPQILGTLTDYAGLVIQLGYTVLFVAAFPLAPTMAFISSYIQVRIDGWKLCQAFRRPQPKNAEGIGVWQDMIEILGVLALIFNVALVFFTGHYLQDVEWQFRWAILVMLVHAVLALRYVLKASIEDIPSEVQMQLDRQEFLVSKVIKNIEDERNDVFSQSVIAANFVIHEVDNDFEEVGQDEPARKNN